MQLKEGYEVYYKSENNRVYIVSRFSQSYGKKYVHLVPKDNPDTKQPLRTVLPLAEAYFAFPDNIADILAEF